MSRVPSVGILGFEHYHANFWTKAFQHSADAILVGFWEPDEGLAAKAEATHGIKRWADREALVAASDAVAICSATSAHEPLIAAAAQLGKAVLCEKPLGVTADACARIEAIVRRAGIPFMQSFPKRFDPINAEIIDLVSSGRLGTIALCRIRHGHSHGLSSDFSKAWFVDPQRSGGGTLLDEGIHAADFLRWAFGEPARVSATISSATLGLPVEDTAVATFHYSGGLLAEVAASWCFAAADTSIEIYGTKGTVLLSGVDIASRPARESGFLRIFERDGPQQGWRESQTVPHFKTGVFHEHVAWAFAGALRRGTPMPVTVADGRRAFAMIDAAYRSAASGSMETIAYTAQADGASRI